MLERLLRIGSETRTRSRGFYPVRRIMSMKKHAFLLLLTSLVLGCSAASVAQVPTGKSAPAFTLTGIDGKSYSLSDFKGKYVVLEWINFGCPFVKKHYDAKNMQNLQEKWKGKDVVWLTICSSAPGKQGYYDAAGAQQALKERNASPTAYLLDTDGKVGKAYGATATPHMYVVDPKGTLIYQGAIDSIRSANPADISKAENYVESALTSHMAGKKVATGTTQAYGCSVKY